MIRIFWIILAAAVIITGFCCFYAYSWLGSIGDPVIAASGYQFHSWFAWTSLWAAFIVLLLLSFFIQGRIGPKWASWVAVLFFGVFLLLLGFNDSSYSEFVTENGLSDSQPLLNPFFIAVLLVLAIIAVAVIQVIISNLSGKREEEQPKELEEGKDEEENAEAAEE